MKNLLLVVPLLVEHRFDAAVLVFLALALVKRIGAGEGGRVYLAKDARMAREAFTPRYAALDRFAALRHDRGCDRVFRSRLSDRLEM